jgi:hypothetical protein
MIKTISQINKKLKIICIAFIVFEHEDINESRTEWLKINNHKDKRWLEYSFCHKLFSIVTEDNANRIFIYRKGFEKYLIEQQWNKRFKLD